MFRRPLFLPLLAWIIGILIAGMLPFALAATLAVLMAGAGAALLLPATSRRSALLSMLALGVGLGTLRTLAFLRVSPYDLSRGIRPGQRREVVVYGRLLDDPQAMPNRLAFPLQIEAVVANGRPIPAAGRAQVSLYPEWNAARNRSERHASPVEELEQSVAGRLIYGTRVRLRGRLQLPSPARNPGDFDDQAYLERQSIRSLLTVMGERSVTPVGTADFSWDGLCLATKRRMEAALRSSLPQQDAETMAGLLFSESSRLPQGMQDDFIATGTVHLLSTSGVHVAALAVAIQLLLGSYRRRHRRVFAALFIALLFAFGIMSGMRPAVARAVWMAALVYGADLVDREADGPNLLCFAALVLLVVHPLDLWDVGFQLSFAAVAGLMLLPPHLEPALRRWLRVKESAKGWRSALAQGLAISLSVEVMLFPLLAYHMGQVSLISPFANLVVVPLASPLIPAGLLQASLAPHLSVIGTGFSAGVSGLLWLFGATVHGFARMPLAQVYVPSPPVFLVVSYYAVLLLWLRPWELPDEDDSEVQAERPLLPRRVPALLMGAFFLSPALLIALPSLNLFRGHNLRFTAIDVGQGDCLLIETPDGAAMLVDGGGMRGFGSDDSVTFDVGQRIIVPYLRRMGIRRLDLVLLTHPHDDHVGGLGAVLEQIPTRLVLESGIPNETAPYERFKTAIQRRGIPEQFVAAGDRFQLGREVIGEILAPEVPVFQGTPSDLNNNSVVVRLNYRNFTALLTGDIEAEAEDRLLPRFGPADLLKVAHHGSRFSTSQAFVDSVHPKVALICVGEHNNFGHPNPGVVERLEAAGTRVYRTDRDGTITVETDGQRIWERTFLHRGAPLPAASSASSLREPAFAGTR